MKLLLLAVVLALVSGCVTTQGKVDPYETARTVLGYQDLAFTFADSRFNIWAAKQADKNKVAATKAKYDAIVKATQDGLTALSEGVTTAEKVGKKVDQVNLHTQVRKLVKALFNFVLSLEMAITEETPQSRPTTELRDLYNSMLLAFR